MPGVMFTIASPDGPPSLSEVSSRLKVDLSSLDSEFGVTAIDPRRGLYAVMVDERVAASLQPDDPAAGGPFSNPAIGTFGPPRR